MGGMGVLGAMGVFGSACPNRLTAPKPLCSPPHCLCRPAFAALLCNLCYLCYLCYLCERRPAALLPPCRPYRPALAALLCNLCYLYERRPAALLPPPPAPCRRLPPPLSSLSSLAALPGRAAPKKTSVSLHHEMPDTGVFRSTVRGCRSHLFGCFFSYAPALSTSGAPQETVKQNKPKQ